MQDQSSLFGPDDTPSSQKTSLPTSSAASTNPGEPLASRMRPRTLDEILGQEHLLAPGRVVRRSIEEDRITSMILWGPPGSGITIDEDAIQQTAIFANGDARTALNVLELAASAALTPSGNRDLEERSIAPAAHITLPLVEEIMQHRALLYDKSGDQHYDTISALHKSLRGSDPDAGLYWLARMLEAGEDPLYIVRRLIRFASEDVGMADPQALLVCVAAQQAVHFVGLPEANLAFAQAVVHLATAPKSNALEAAYSRVQEDVQQTRNDPVPLWIRNAPTQLMKDLDYGKDYIYAHDYYKDMQIDDPERPPSAQLQEYLPDNLKGRRFYEPGQQGKEASIKRWLEKRRQEK